MTTPDPFITADWLMTHIDAPDVRVIDATWLLPWAETDQSARQQYDAAHIPGAVYFNIDEIADTESSLPHMLPGPVKFSSMVRKLGLGDGNRIVAYDSNGLFASARAWWMFRAMGHEDVFVMDGGLKAWLAAGGTTEDLPPVTVERHFTPRARADLIRDKAQMKQASEEANMLILDARPATRFSGDVPEAREGLASGHIPGTHNLPCEELFTEDGLMKSGEALENVFASRKLQAADVRVATCGSGVSAAIIVLALARLGYGEVALYDGSWTEWGSDPSLPKEMTGA